MAQVKVLAFITYYLPAYKAGGPVQSVSNMVERLCDHISIKILTSDRDIGEHTPFNSIKVNQWNTVGSALVFYLRSRQYTPLKIRSILNGIDYDVVYLNSYFSFRYSILPTTLWKFGVIKNTPFIIAPRGEFSTGALGLKKFKKRVFIMLARAMGLYRDVIWQASSSRERDDIKNSFGKNANVLVAKNMSPLIKGDEISRSFRHKRKGYLKIIFLSRIAPMKNLHFALEMLKGLGGKLSFAIYGPIEDVRYWSRCQEIIREFDDKVKVKYHGTVEHDRVHSLMSENDIFFLPTLGENYGHVILEALSAGCPVLISDQTPWLELEKKGVGWDIPLRDFEKYQDILQKCISMDSYEYIKWSKKAQEYGLNAAGNEEVVKQHLRLFYSKNINNSITKFGE